MITRTIGHAALVVAVGLLLVVTSQLSDAAANGAAQQAETVSKSLALTKTTKSPARTVSQLRAAKVTALKAAKKAALAAKQAKIRAAAVREKELPATVANANAMMTGSDAHGAADMSGAAPLEVAAADQLNELGRSLNALPANDEARGIATQLATSDQPQSDVPIIAAEAAPAISHMRSGTSGDPWAQSSLVGKLFIAVGGMLTLASAARMLVA